MEISRSISSRFCSWLFTVARIRWSECMENGWLLPWGWVCPQGRDPKGSPPENSRKIHSTASSNNCSNTYPKGLPICNKWKVRKTVIHLIYRITPRREANLIIYCRECTNVWEDISKLQNSLTYHVGLVQRGQSIHWCGADLGSYKGKKKKKPKFPLYEQVKIFGP